MNLKYKNKKSVEKCNYFFTLFLSYLYMTVSLSSVSADVVSEVGNWGNTSSSTLVAGIIKDIIP